MLKILWVGEKVVKKKFLKMLPPPRIFRFFFEKNEKCLEFSDLARKLIRKTVRQFPPPDMCAKKIPLVSMGGRAEGLACADPGARTPIGASGNLNILSLPKFYHCATFWPICRSEVLKLYPNLGIFQFVLKFLFPALTHTYDSWCISHHKNCIEGAKVIHDKIQSIKCSFFYIWLNTNEYFSSWN